MFQTKIDIPTSDFQISYSNHIMTLGSCFAENIGKKMKDVYFETEINPFGVLYNPISIVNSINLLLDKKCFSEQDLFKYNSQWQSFSHSTYFSDISVESCLEKINSRYIKATDFLHKTDYLFITLGTTWVYEDKASGNVVSNCHKLPASYFSRRRMSVDEITFLFTEVFEKLKTIRPNIQLIFSLSPIRHWKDGAHENNISKSTLLLAIDDLQNEFSNVHYFPAYEIQMDELRDYRFYSADMLHPSEVAINYIWQRFSETYFNEQTSKIKLELEKLSSDLNHRPINQQSNEFKKFTDYLNRKIVDLKLKYPFLEGKI